MNKEYKPHAKEAGILDSAMEHVKSVPYRATPRWLFYRVFQDTTLCSWRRQTFHPDNGQPAGHTHQSSESIDSNLIVRFDSIG